MILHRFLEFLPLALVLGTTMAALRHPDLPTIQRTALRDTGKIVGWLVIGCLLVQVALAFLQD